MTNLEKNLLPIFFNSDLTLNKEGKLYEWFVDKILRKKLGEEINGSFTLNDRQTHAHADTDIGYGNSVEVVWNNEGAEKKFLMAVQYVSLKEIFKKPTIH
jgi:hypothetical protein